MRFIGYIVDGKKYGAGQRKKAEEHARKSGKKITTWSYKI